MGKSGHAVVYSLAWPLMATLWIALTQKYTTAVQDYELPVVCDGRNPIEYLGIRSSLPDAEYRLAEKLNDRNVEIALIYCTLRVDNITYASGQCPGNGWISANDLPGGNVTLAFALSHESIFARTYLSIQAPTRYYSMSLLAKHVAWCASESQTLRLALKASNTSRECWNASNWHQRRAFVHRLVNHTLTNVRQLVNRSAEWLDGKLYARTQTAHRNPFSGWPFPFGRSYRYEECNNARLPLSVSLDASTIANLNYTLCSRWVVFDESNTALPQVLTWIMIALFVYVSLVVFAYLWPWLHGKWYNEIGRSLRLAYPWPNRRELNISHFQVRNKCQCAKPPTSVQYARNSRRFPKELSVGYLARARFEEEARSQFVLRRLTAFLLSRNPVVWFFFFLGCLYLGLTFLNVGLPTVLGQDFDSHADLLSPCYSDGQNLFVIISSGAVFVIALTIVILTLYDYCGYWWSPKGQGKENPARLRGWRGFKRTSSKHNSNVGFDYVDVSSSTTWEEQTATEGSASTRVKKRFEIKVKMGLSLIVLLVFPVVLMPLVANLLLIAAFTVIGLVVYERSYLLFGLAVAKVLLFDVMKLGRVNEAISPGIARCKRACDTAARELVDEILRESAVATREAWVPGQGREEHNKHHLIRLFGRTESRYSESPGRSISLISKINKCSTRVFLRLTQYSHVSRHTIVTQNTQQHHTVKTLVNRCANPNSSNSPPLTFLSSVPTGLSPTDHELCMVWRDLVKQTLDAFERFVVTCAAALIGWLAVLFLMSVVLIHIGRLTDTSNWVELLIPAAVLLQSVGQTLRARLQSADPFEEELVVEAKALYLLFAAELDDAILGENGSLLVRNLDAVPKSSFWSICRATSQKGKREDHSSKEGACCSCCSLGFSLFQKRNHRPVATSQANLPNGAPSVEASPSSVLPIASGRGQTAMLNPGTSQSSLDVHGKKTMTDEIRREQENGVPAHKTPPLDTDHASSVKQPHEQQAALCVSAHNGSQLVRSGHDSATLDPSQGSTLEDQAAQVNQPYELRTMPHTQSKTLAFSGSVGENDMPDSGVGTSLNRGTWM